jgi:CheY-like chemotaxis protein
MLRREGVEKLLSKPIEPRELAEAISVALAGKPDVSVGPGAENPVA